jgi:hypothetical protein
MRAEETRARADEMKEAQPKAIMLRIDGIAANIAKMPELLRKPPAQDGEGVSPVSS